MAAPALSHDQSATPDEPVLSGTPCQRCKQVLDGPYFEANGAAVCLGCTEAMEGSFAVAFALGTAAAVASAGLYYAIWSLLGVRFSLVAVLAGVLVGMAVRRGSGSRSSGLNRSLAVVLTYLSVVATYAHSVLTDTPGVEIIELVRITLVLPVVMISQGENLVTLVLLGFALHEAWQFSRPPHLNVEGPYDVLKR